MGKGMGDGRMWGFEMGVGDMREFLYQRSVTSELGALEW